MKKTVLAIITSLLVLSFFSVFTPKARSILPPPPPNPLVEAGFAYRNPGENFSLPITMNNLDEQWQVIGIQFELCYNNTLLTPISVNEGPFLKNPAWAPDGTFFISFVNDPDGINGPNVQIGNLILPNSTGYYNPPFSSGNGTLATIQFSVNQSASLHDKCDLTLADVMLVNSTGGLLPCDIQNGFLQIGRFLADTNGDGMVDGNDLIVIARAFGAYGPDFMWPGSEHHLRWDPSADVNGDNVIDGSDLVIAARSFGKTYP
jgi:hypothetical protein